MPVTALVAPDAPAAPPAASTEPKLRGRPDADPAMGLVNLHADGEGLNSFEVSLTQARAKVGESRNVRDGHALVGRRHHPMNLCDRVSRVHEEITYAGDKAGDGYTRGDMRRPITRDSGRDGMP